MIESRTRRRISRRRKKTIIPLSKLRTPDAVRTVVDHPRRLDELLALLEDSDRALRGRAAATLARLSESHPIRLTRAMERLRGGLGDESAYVRWHLAYALGEVGQKYPAKSRCCLEALRDRLQDSNGIVRFFACRALERIALRKPQFISELFSRENREIPGSLARILESRGSKTETGQSESRNPKRNRRN